MSTTHTTHRCDAEIEDWGPHPGCAEYMSQPDSTHRCQHEATATYVVAEYDQDGTHVVTYHRCQEHRLLMPLPYATLLGIEEL